MGKGGTGANAAAAKTRPVEDEQAHLVPQAAESNARANVWAGGGGDRGRVEQHAERRTQERSKSRRWRQPNSDRSTESA